MKTTTTIAVTELSAILATARSLGLNLSAMHALLLLAEHEDLPMTSLADHLGISTAAITGTADGLAQKGLVRRTRASADRRIVSLALTETGRHRVFQLTGDANLVTI